jgi:hypothetical protein
MVSVPRLDAVAAPHRDASSGLKQVVAATFERFLDAYRRRDISGVLSTLAFSEPHLAFNFHDCSYTGGLGSTVTSVTGMRAWLRDRFAENDGFANIRLVQDGEDLAIGMQATRRNDILWARGRSVRLVPKWIAVPDGTKFWKAVLDLCDALPRLVSASPEKSRATVEAFVDAVSANDPAYVRRLLGKSVRYVGCDASGTHRVVSTGKAQTEARIRTLMREGWAYTVESLSVMRRHGQYLVSATVRAGNTNSGTGSSLRPLASCSASGHLVLLFGLSPNGSQVRSIDAASGSC